MSETCRRRQLFKQVGDCAVHNELQDELLELRSFFFGFLLLLG